MRSLPTTYKPVFLNPPIPVAVLGIPIPGKNNPYLIFKTGDAVEIEATLSEKLKLTASFTMRYRGTVYGIIKESLKLLEELFGEKLNLRLNLRSTVIPSPLHIVASTLYTLLEFVKREYYRLSRDEYLQLLGLMSKPAPAHLRGLLEGTVACMYLNTPLVYRRGEGLLELEEDLTSRFKVEWRWRRGKLVFLDNPLLEELTLLTGRIVVEGSRCLLRGDLECFSKLFLLDSYISRSMYGGGVFEDSKISPDVEGYISTRLVGRAQV